jgi:hypothetical protein
MNNTPQHDKEVIDARTLALIGIKQTLLEQPEDATLTIISRDDLQRVMDDLEHKTAAYECFQLGWRNAVTDPPLDSNRVLIQRPISPHNPVVEVLTATYHSAKREWFDTRWQFLRDTGEMPTAWRKMIVTEIV